MIGPVQIGQSDEDGGAGTVRIGRRDEAAIGGEGLCCDDEGLSESDGGCCCDFWCFVFENVVDVRPEITGGGRSRLSAAFRDNCRAKSDACHHSRNLSAKMDVGRRMRREERRRGYTVWPSVRGLNNEVPSPGIRPGRGGAGFGFVANSIAW